MAAHDVLGRDAIVADLAAGGRARVLVGLMWNDADVAAALASLLGDGLSACRPAAPTSRSCVENERLTNS